MWHRDTPAQPFTKKVDQKMTLDYVKLGLKCGIEIHQQLNTNKLFCDCPSQIRDDEPKITVKRKMRAVAGELGDIDPAALHEFLRNKVFVYQSYDSNCLVELDEEPPHKLNEDALDIGIQIALMLNARIVDELQVMRKTVIDGSNTTGFQRTLLIGMGGYIETSGIKIGIPTICLEEDAARKISETQNEVVYRLDRLGIPLIEIGTTPDIKSPTQAREVAEKIGMILRATGRVKRGLGTIRQDLNVSILNGERIEVKGVQDLRLVSKVVEIEVERQMMLLEIKDELKRRNVDESGLKNDFIDVKKIFETTKSPIIRKAIDENRAVIAVKLNGFSGLLKNRFGPELAQYVRAITNVEGIIHSDELPGYGISGEELKELQDFLKLKGYDAFVMIASKKEIAEKSLEIVVQRCKIALHGVPKETRRALEDGRTEFMRPLPGSARMYPETDSLQIALSEERIERLRKSIPMLPDDRVTYLTDLGLSNELANQLVRSEKIGIFDRFIKKYPNIKASHIATLLIMTPKEIKKRYNIDTDLLDEKHFEDILNCLSKGKISRDAIIEILVEMATDPKANAADIIAKKNLGILSKNEIDDIIEDMISKNPGLTTDQLLGRIMARVKGRAEVEYIRSAIIDRLNKG